MLQERAKEHCLFDQRELIAETTAEQVIMVSVKISERNKEHTKHVISVKMEGNRTELLVC